MSNGNNKPLTEYEVIRAIDAHIIDAMHSLRDMPESDVRGGSMAALLAMRISLRDGSWRPKKTNVVPISSARKK
jgi:hypothetical protein